MTERKIIQVPPLFDKQQSKKNSLFGFNAPTNQQPNQSNLNPFGKSSDNATELNIFSSGNTNSFISKPASNPFSNIFSNQVDSKPKSLFGVKQQIKTSPGFMIPATTINPFSTQFSNQQDSKPKQSKSLFESKQQIKTSPGFMMQNLFSNAPPAKQQRKQIWKPIIVPHPQPKKQEIKEQVLIYKKRPEKPKRQPIPIEIVQQSLIDQLPNIKQLDKKVAIRKMLQVKTKEARKLLEKEKMEKVIMQSRKQNLQQKLKSLNKQIEQFEPLKQTLRVKQFSHSVARMKEIEVPENDEFNFQVSEINELMDKRQIMMFEVEDKEKQIAIAKAEIEKLQKQTEFKNEQYERLKQYRLKKKRQQNQQLNKQIEKQLQIYRKRKEQSKRKEIGISQIRKEYCSSEIHQGNIEFENNNLNLVDRLKKTPVIGKILTFVGY